MKAWSGIFITLKTHAHYLHKKKKQIQFSVRESVSLEGKRKSELLLQFAFSFCAQFTTQVEPGLINPFKWNN